MNFKRDLVKYVRDKAKSQYKKSSDCYICGNSKDLDFHHYHGLTELLETWIKKNKLNISNEQEILEIRQAFIDEHYKELYEDTVTLCHSHHMKLHSSDGKRPKLIHAEKQKRWVEKQRDKYGMV